jgi:uncharacterized protein YcaQ
MPPPRFLLRAVAALFLERQHLTRPRARRLTPHRLVRFVEDVGGLQLDSINVLDRAHYLTLWSRFGPYDRARLDRLVYRQRTLFEYWAHAACLVPVAHLGPWRRAMLDYRLRHTGWSSWLRRHRRTLDLVTEAIRANGPAGTADFEHRRPGGRSGWWSWKPAQHALHYLWMTGALGVHSRPHFQKRYDLAERIWPPGLGVDPPSTEAFRAWHVERSLHAMGGATDTDLTRYLTFPRMGPGIRRAALRRLVETGDVVEIEVEGSRGRWLALARDLPALGRAARRRAAARGTTLLSPFDSLLWHRARVERLFGFSYRIEVYTPGPQRIHGYYTLPILHDGQLIGRVDAKAHRAERRLAVRSVHFERWFATGGVPPAAAWGAVEQDQALVGVAEALWSLARFTGADDVDLGRVVPGRLRGPLGRALRAVAAPGPAARSAARVPVPAATAGGPAVGDRRRGGPVESDVRQDTVVVRRPPDGAGPARLVQDDATSEDPARHARSGHE